MPISHVSLPVSSLSTSRSFYLAALAPLKYNVFMDMEGTVGFEKRFNGPDFWVHKCPKETEIKDALKSHVAFVAKSKEQVREFYQAALIAGGTDNGKPGERQYTKGYYAAYVLDPDGHNIECLYFRPLLLTAIDTAPWLGAAAFAAVAWWIGRNGLPVY